MVYTINIAKAYTYKDWQGLPAHQFFARLHLDTTSEGLAKAELERLQGVYPWPDYHLTLQSSETRTVSNTVLSSATPEFLAKHRWDYPTNNKGEE